ncbi:MAG: glutathione S-transferase family protein [Gammaproteobacteria bacterium]|nr:glutathione S-transferase family protein [Gammaproteobacteria bacterium]
MKLYDTNLAPNPRRVRIFMAEKGIACETEQVDIIKGENLSDEYLAVNPRGLVPTLVLDDGTVLDESVAICRYLEETQPEPPLMGSGAVDKARVEARQRHMEFDGLQGAADAFRNSFPLFSSRGLPGSGGAVDAIPELAERGKGRVERFYRRLDEDLGASPFVAGEAFSIADITALCTVDFAVAAARIPIPDDCENVRRWHARVSARPSAQA